jgi:hypothetical protein
MIASVATGNRMWPARLARAFAILRAAMLIVFCVFLILAPEKAMPGSSTEPARALALVFASRTILLGIAFVVLALRCRSKALAWVFFADAILQLFDTGMALAMQKGAVAVLPAALGALDVWAGLVLLRSARAANPVEP